MDPRRLLSLAALGLLVSGCALFRGPADVASAPTWDVAATAMAQSDRFAPPARTSPTERPYLAEAGTEVPVVANEAELLPSRSDFSIKEDDATLARVETEPPRPAVTGRPAIAAANAGARAASRSDSFVGGVQVFAYDPGRVYEVWTAPLRVTTLTLAPGETVTAKAAGDTVRWQIGETTSGSGPGQRAHVMIKPLERDLETNLVVTTSQRVYLIQLKSGPTDAFNAAVAWDMGAVLPTGPAGFDEAGSVADPLVGPSGPLDARYRIEPRGRRPRWSPTAVMNDGVRTFITFSAELQVDEAPALFVIAPDGETQMVNYRQQGGLWVVDRVFDRAELRLGDRRPQIVRITREPGGRS